MPGAIYTFIHLRDDGHHGEVELQIAQNRDGLLHMVFQLFAVGRGKLPLLGQHIARDQQPPHRRQLRGVIQRGALTHPILQLVAHPHHQTRHTHVVPGQVGIARFHHAHQGLHGLAQQPHPRFVTLGHKMNGKRQHKRPQHRHQQHHHQIKPGLVNIHEGQRTGRRIFLQHRQGCARHLHHVGEDRGGIDWAAHHAAPRRHPLGDIFEAIGQYR